MSLWHDIHFSVRSLRKQPGLVFTLVIILALGIGANTTIFTAVKAVLLNPLPYKDPVQLVTLYEQGVIHQSVNPVSPPDFYDWQRDSQSLQDMAAFGHTSGTLSGNKSRLPEAVEGAFCSWNLFKTLGVQPALGRTFSKKDDNPEAVRTIILSDGLWRHRFNADPRIIGHTLRLDTSLYTIVGVMPPGFHFWYRAGQYWTPIKAQLAPSELDQRGNLFFTCTWSSPRGDHNPSSYR